MNDIIIQKIIVAVAFTPMIWILYGIMRSYTKPMQNIVLGVTLPYSYLRDEQILGISKVYRKWLLVVALICFFCFVPVFFLNTPLGIYSATVLWAMVSACTIQLPYIRSNAKVKRIKQKSGWNLSNTADKLLINTQVSANKRKGAIKMNL